MTLLYESTGQQLGETRSAMAKTLMKDLEKIIDQYKNIEGKYYVLVHAKPFPNKPNVIKIKFIAMKQACNMLLSCMLFGIDNERGVLTLEWALPGNWPVWSVEGTNTPVPEVIGSLKELGKTFDLNKVLVY